MRAAAAALCTLTACGGGGSHDLHVTTSYTITQFEGLGPSVLDALNGQLVTLDLTIAERGVLHGESRGCRSTIFGEHEPLRTAGGPQAALVQTEILDKIPDWSVTLELCDDPASSRITIDASINELNTAIGCLDVPAAAQLRDGNGDPELPTFVGANCSTTILDVVHNRVLGASGFTVSFDTGGARLP